MRQVERVVVRVGVRDKEDWVWYRPMGQPSALLLHVPLTRMPLRHVRQ